MLEIFFTSKVRIKILKLFFLMKQERLHVREITRLTNEEINAVRRELSRLFKAKLLGREKRGNRLYYFLKTTFIFYTELFRMIIKEYGLGGEIRKKEKELGKVKFAAVAYEFFNNRRETHKEVDLLLVGTISLKVLEELIGRYEKELGKEINYSALTEDEYNEMRQMGNPFIQRFLSQDVIVLIGEEQKR